MGKRTLINEIEGLEEIESIYIKVTPGMNVEQARVVAANVANALGTPLEVLFKIRGVTHSATFK